MTRERYRAEGPDGCVTFSVDEGDPAPLALAARRKAGRDDMTFTRIVPLNDVAKTAVPPSHS